MRGHIGPNRSRVRPGPAGPAERGPERNGGAVDEVPGTARAWSGAWSPAATEARQCCADSRAERSPRGHGTLCSTAQPSRHKNGPAPTRGTGPVRVCHSLRAPLRPSRPGAPHALRRIQSGGADRFAGTGAETGGSLLGVKAGEHNNFAVGNILAEIIGGMLDGAYETLYVRGFLEGVRSCRKSCGFFAFCQGGRVGSRFFEPADFTTTETNCCRLARQQLVLAFSDDAEKWDERSRKSGAGRSGAPAAGQGRPDSRGFQMGQPEYMGQLEQAVAENAENVCGDQTSARGQSPAAQCG